MGGYDINNVKRSLEHLSNSFAFSSSQQTCTFLAIGLVRIKN